MLICPVGYEPEIHKDEVTFLPVYLSIFIFELVSSFPLKVNDLFTSKGDTTISEVKNGFSILIHFRNLILL
jgi:hypothetical protein